MADGTVARSSRAHRTICLPISEDSYTRAVDDPAAFRRRLDEGFRAAPELFPPGFDRGYGLKDDRTSAKRGTPIRRIRLRDGAAYSVRPSFLMPYMTARVADVEGPLFLRTFGVPFWALARVFGRDPMYWYRLTCGLGRSSVVGTTARQAGIPAHLLADEHHQTIDGEKVYVATTVGDGCVLGAEPAASAGVAELTAAYGAFQAEARDVEPEYAPRTVSVDGWASTHQAWLTLFPLVVLLRCFPHGWLSVRSRGELSESFRELSKRVWESYRAPSRRAFAQRLRRLREWARGRGMSAWLLGQVEKLCGRSKEYAVAYSHPGGHRTSNMLDRAMRGMNRYFDRGQHLHGLPAACRLHGRSWALLANFAPWHPAVARANAGWRCPAERSTAIATTTTGSRTCSSPPPSAATGRLPPKIRDGQEKKARRQGAHIALIDESGLLMAPLTRRTWAPRGQTPELLQKGGSREKVSVAAAVWLSPRRDRLGLYTHTLAKGDFDSWHMAAFLEVMLKDLAGRFVIVWDGGPMHKGDPIRELMGHFADRLDLERLPPYAPMLNPVEPLWSRLKWGRLPNLGPKDSHALEARAIAELAKVRDDQAFLRNLFHASELPLPRALLS